MKYSLTYVSVHLHCLTSKQNLAGFGGHTEKQYRIVSILLVFDFCQSQNKPNTRAYMG